MAHQTTASISRRQFIQGSAASLAALGVMGGRLYAAGSDKIRVGLIGCGSRGARGPCGIASIPRPTSRSPRWAICSRTAIDACLSVLKKNGGQGVELLAALEACGQGESHAGDVLHRIRRLQESHQQRRVDLVILATSPHFRPMHLKAAVEAGKHVFMEKPVAVDPVGIRSVLASSELAKQKGLAIVAGTQRRHDPQVRRGHEARPQRRYRRDRRRPVLLAGALRAQLGLLPRAAACDGRTWSTQCRNWYFYAWLSGDHIVEQHVHNIDVINWAMGAPPGDGAGHGRPAGPHRARVRQHLRPFRRRIRVRQRRPRPEHGPADRWAVPTRVAERIVGTKGVARRGPHRRRQPFKYSGPTPNPYEQEHADLIQSIRDGRPLNEGKQVAESTMTAIIGRMSAYTGRTLKWDWAMNASKQDLTPPTYEMGTLPVAPVPVPGKTPLV